MGRTSSNDLVKEETKLSPPKSRKLNLKGGPRRDAHSRDLLRDEALLRAFRAVGGQSALALLLNRSKQATWHWLRVPSQYVLKVEELTGISRYELRPDLYPREEVRKGAGKEVSRAH
ncbi:YdaS family helix-turn-helix protein [Hyphomicrobium sp.]|uniref:transcriptional regulator n=1 Tax=Hyphomicrobium sp. TaxID=82 RepID=UPI00345987F5